MDKISTPKSSFILWSRIIRETGYRHSMDTKTLIFILKTNNLISTQPRLGGLLCNPIKPLNRANVFPLLDQYLQLSWWGRFKLSRQAARQWDKWTVTKELK